MYNQPDNRLRDIITISAVSFSDKQNLVTDTNGNKYSFFQTKKTGEVTEAYKTAQTLRNGDTVQVVYRQNGQYKNALGFYTPKEGDFKGSPTRTASTNPPVAQRSPRPGVAVDKDTLIGILALIKSSMEAGQTSVADITNPAKIAEFVAAYRNIQNAATPANSTQDINVEDIPF